MKSGNDNLQSSGSKGNADNERRMPEEVLHTLVNSFPAYLYSVQYQDGLFLDAVYSPRCEMITGYKSAEHKRDPSLWLKMAHPLGQERVRHFITSIASLSKGNPSNDKAFTLEYRIMHKEGVGRWINNRFVVSQDDKTETIWLDGFVVDITEQKYMEELARIKQ